MTEYAIPPHRLPEFMSARERTAHWVNNYSPEAVYSPSYPPTPIEGMNVPPSPAVSTHSLPPQMVLRYNDGRGDVPIPHPASDYHSRSDRRHRVHHSSSNSSSPLSPRSRDTPPPPTPEEIRVLPSRPINNSSSTSSSRQSHTHGKSIPRPQTTPPREEIPTGAHSRPRLPTLATGTQAYSPWVHPGPQAHHSRHVSASTYPAGQQRYPDPSAFHHPPRVGPDGMIYSHSAPPVVGVGYAPQHPGMYPQPYHGEERIGRGRERHMSTGYGRGRRPVNPVHSSGSAESDGSENTYYMDGQKVHVLAHSPERSVDTASSTTKVASPYSQGSAKKPFFSRIFGLGGQKPSSPSSAKGATMPSGRKLQRRHSVGESQRPLNARHHH
ncbi:hypothetical protein CC1G_01069 [Coprinopsis cinerea okayama7|uniref:Uncharacterized protein n=1 Tax=Coprinopsis cinerea (strain Okayama-7 / 130 / ATCC MYA-4618 / FGSC 9003) TaxID=240176 RepID=A8NEE9_COPC7|nr:hypothetical protein CC1G_01069 [Coprinopsis cinerea okayama7\|eukprot:XP_001833007.2 hypothetical protein CC1G_01069 [Coprinopsis cinerea okayama7\